MILPDPLTTFIESEQCPTSPSIDDSLLIPCYEDLLPSVIKDDSAEGRLKALSDDYTKMSMCFHRQYQLILELKNVRELNK